jgi:hypothetical protein
LSSSARAATQTGLSVFTSSLLGLVDGIRACWRETETEGGALGES